MKKALTALLSLMLILSLLTGCAPAAQSRPIQATAVPEQDAPGLVLLTPVPEAEDSESSAVSTETDAPTATPAPTDTPCPVTEDGIYDSRDEVALYIHLFGHLPSNYITKKQAEKLGWPGGKLEPYAPGKCIGGDYFGNYQGLLPNAKGRKYFECDVDTMGRKRNEKRIVYSNDGLIYYTPDHYESFELLYGEE